jgi:DNA-binding transcriptional ArsR family regulator
MSVDKVLRAVADPSRRVLLERLQARDGLTLTELWGCLDMTRQAVSRHLAVLEEAGLVTCRWRGREKLHHLDPGPLLDVRDRWIGRFEPPRRRPLLAIGGER